MGKESARGSWRGRGTGRGRGHFHKNRISHYSTTKYQHNQDKNLNNEKKGFLKESVGERLAEVDVGITEYISNYNGFSGIIKERYSDFQVNEINLDEEVVKLTSYDVPRQVKGGATDGAAAPVSTRHELIPLEVWNKLISLVDENTLHLKHSGKDETLLQTQLKPSEESGNNVASDIKADKSADLNAEVVVEERGVENVELEVTNLDKNSRRAIHSCVKESFQNVISNTKDRDGKKYIVFLKGKDTRQNAGGKFLYFVVNKRNMDTAETVNLLCQMLRLKPSMITYAGTKDRRGITSQQMCLRGGDPHRLFWISKKLKGIAIGGYSFKEQGLRLGDLKGNQFRIALRNVQGTDEDIEKAMLSLKQFGFINYFGLQRFGSNYAIPTYEIGKLFLQEKWDKAVEMILRPRAENPRMDGDDVSAACKEWLASRNAKQAVAKLCSGPVSIEGSLLMGLSKCAPNDYIGGLSALARNTRSLYLHSYQSLIWNKVVSRRVREYGLLPLVGDLVLCGDAEMDSVDTADCAVPAVDSMEPDHKEDTACIKQQVRCITQEDLSSVNIKDIVLPMPGYDTEYPENVIKSWYMELLKEDNLSFKSFRSTVQQYSIRGAYRHIISCPKNVSWSTVHYTDPSVDLLLSDIEEMAGKTPFQDQPDAIYKALLVTMQLSPSTYATMALREIMKTDTSVSNQIKIASDMTRKEAERASDKNNGHQVVDDSNTDSKSGIKQEDIEIIMEVKSNANKVTGADSNSSLKESEDQPADAKSSLTQGKLLEAQPVSNVETSEDSISDLKRRAEESLDGHSSEEKKLKLGV